MAACSCLPPLATTYLLLPLAPFPVRRFPILVLPPPGPPEPFKGFLSLGADLARVITKHSLFTAPAAAGYDGGAAVAAGTADDSGVLLVLYSAAFVLLRAVDGSYAPGGRFFAPAAAAATSTAVPLLGFAMTPAVFALAGSLNTAFMAHLNVPRYAMELREATGELLRFRIE